MKPITYDQVLQACENDSRTYEHLQEKIKIISQSNFNKINCKKIEQYSKKKFDTKKKELVNMVCNQMVEKLQSVCERQISKLMKDWNVHENLKILDYIVDRNGIMNTVREDPYDWYDQEEEYLDNLKEGLKQHYKRI